MLQLLTPAGLWALAALSLPLAVHLWRPPPRTVRLGSLRFLENVPRRLRHLRWREPLLLAARLALLALLALLLAGAVWQRRPSRAPQHWLLLDPDAAPAGASLARLRAAPSAGDAPRLLAPGFPPATLPLPSRPPADLWSLLREADAELPPGSTLTVFSPGHLASLRGSRPRMTHCRVEWIETPARPLPTAPVVPRSDPPPLRVLIQADPDRAADARNLAAAVTAAAQVSHHPIDLQQDPTPGHSVETDWLLWLGVQPIPPDRAEHSANLLAEFAAPAAADLPATWIVPAPDAADAPRLWQRTPPSAAPADAVYWTDGFGQPLLTATPAARGWRWRFAGRFDPAWTSLPLGSAFPAALRDLLFPPPPADPADDRRLADPSQCHPSDAPTPTSKVTLTRAGDNVADLHPLLWTLAGVAFVFERLWSHRFPAAR